MYYLIPISISLLAILTSGYAEMELLSQKWTRAEAGVINWLAIILVLCSAVVGYFLRPREEYRRTKETRRKAIWRIIYRVLALLAILYIIATAQRIRDSIGFYFSILVAAYCSYSLLISANWYRAYVLAARIQQSNSIKTPLTFFGLSHFRIVHFNEDALKCRFLPEFQDWLLFLVTLAVNVAFLWMLLVENGSVRFVWEGSELKFVLNLLLCIATIFIFRVSIWKNLGFLELSRTLFRVKRGFKLQEFRREDVQALEVYEQVQESTMVDPDYHTVRRSFYSYGAAVYAKLKQEPAREKFVTVLAGKSEYEADLISRFFAQSCGALGW